MKFLVLSDNRTRVNCDAIESIRVGEYEPGEGWPVLVCTGIEPHLDRYEKDELAAAAAVEWLCDRATGNGAVDTPEPVLAELAEVSDPSLTADCGSCHTALTWRGEAGWKHDLPPEGGTRNWCNTQNPVNVRAVQPDPFDVGLAELLGERPPDTAVLRDVFKSKPDGGCEACAS